VLGIYTDGDLRRTLDSGRELTDTRIDEVMTRNVKTVREDMLAAEAVRLMEAFAITALLVVDEAAGWSAPSTSTTCCKRE
jgi:arabinose-5-phosphate isomerase